MIILEQVSQISSIDKLHDGTNAPLCFSIINFAGIFDKIRMIDLSKRLQLPVKAVG